MLKLTQKSEFFPLWAHSAETSATNSRVALRTLAPSPWKKRGSHHKQPTRRWELAGTKRGEKVLLFFNSRFLLTARKLPNPSTLGRARTLLHHWAPLWHKDTATGTLTVCIDRKLTAVRKLVVLLSPRIIPKWMWPTTTRASLSWTETHADPNPPYHYHHLTPGVRNCPFPRRCSLVKGYIVSGPVSAGGCGQDGGTSVRPGELRLFWWALPGQHRRRGAAKLREPRRVISVTSKYRSQLTNSIQHSPVCKNCLHH